MTSPQEPTQTGNTAHCLPPSPKELAKSRQRFKESLDKAGQVMAAAMAEANRRGVPLHDIIPVH